MEKKIHNIFKKPKPQTKKQEQKQTIIIDYREKNCLVASELVNLGLNIEFRELKSADYIVNNTAIERKTIQDFLSSMTSKRLINQLNSMQQYENKLLIIEGIDEQDLYNENKSGIHANAIRGFLLSITLKHKIPIIYTKNHQDTAKFIAVLSKKKEKQMSLNITKKPLNKKEQMQFILEGFPGIGPSNSKKLLNKFKTIKNIINTSENELKEIIGKKAEILKKITEQDY
jgi:Fanconi anemia group M protein